MAAPSDDIFPGMLTPNAAGLLNAGLSLGRETAGRVAGMVSADEEMFKWAKLTSYNSSTGYYAWTRQDRDANGEFYDHITGESGDGENYNLLATLSGDVIDTTSQPIVLIRWIKSIGGKVLYETVSGPGTSEPVGGGSGPTFAISSGRLQAGVDYPGVILNTSASPGSYDVFTSLQPGKYYHAAIGIQRSFQQLAGTWDANLLVAFNLVLQYPAATYEFVASNGAFATLGATLQNYYVKQDGLDSFAFAIVKQGWFQVSAASKLTASGWISTKAYTGVPASFSASEFLSYSLLEITP